jgi:murein DD-endopeptidase MepM/ murein hydrolase activator NlpD
MCHVLGIFVNRKFDEKLSCFSLILPSIAPADEKVIKTGRNHIIGNYIKIKHDDRFTTNYGYLSKQLVKKGGKVKCEQVIGLMD